MWNATRMMVCTVHLLVVTFLAGCASGPRTLQALADDPDTARMEISRTEQGLFVVNTALNGGEAVPFLLDTGATRSALFEDWLEDVDVTPDRAVRVHGMAGVNIRNTVRVGSFHLGEETLPDLQMIVLPAREYDTPPLYKPAGIVGMDVLSRYRLFARADSDRILLIPIDEPEPEVPSHWSVVQLVENPYNTKAQTLKFVEMRVNGVLGPALLDTGSAVNVMNFELADFPGVRAAKRRLRENWEVRGATEEFRPRVLLRDVDVRAGSRVWRDKNFVVKDVGSLDVLGVRGRPFIIAGADFFADETFYLDPSADVLRMPKGEARQGYAVRYGQSPSGRVGRDR